MRLLVIGGTGNISSEFTEAAIARGFDTILLTRGTRSVPDGAKAIIADASIPSELGAAIGDMSFDSIVDFLCFEPGRARSAVEIFRGRTGQYVFISSAAAYQKPPRDHVIDERTPLENPFWAYARDKIACERIFMDAYRNGNFPATIVRPSHTYGKTWIPTAFVSSDFTVAARMLAGKEIIVPGDGQSLWTLTHARDFAVGLVGLLGRREALGEAFTIAGDEARTWDAIHRIIGEALGATPRIVHVPSEFIAAVDAAMGERLLGDKAYSAVFDCAKLRRLVPEFRATVPLERGVRESVAWRRADPSRMAVDGILDARIEKILAAWKNAMGAAVE